jgi:DNA-directed RNA polymerase subunit H (RpoH/RPB5)
MFSQAIQTVKEMYNLRGWIIIKEEPRTILARDDKIYAIAKFIETTQDIKIPPISLMIDSSTNDFYTDDNSIKYGCITIICNCSITTNVKKLEQTTGGIVEIFHNNNLQINITTYHLQPKFYKLSQEDAIDFKNKYMKKRNTKFIKNFSTMLRSDPIARFFRYHAGDIIRITTQNDDVSYRVVK